jgi:subtilisin-like proprotein convertase family protein
MTFGGKSSVPARALFAASLAAVLGVLGTAALPGAAAAEKKGPPASGAAAAGSAHDVTREEAENDPDLPGFLEGTIDKGEYLRLRQEQVEERRGLPYQPGKKDPANPRLQAIRQMQRSMQLQRDALTPGGLPPANWESVGPAPIPNGQTTTRSDPVSGRVTAIAVDPTNPDHVYVGAAQGGVYRSLDGGVTWTAIFDSAQSLAIGALALAPSNPTILYVGTGEGNLSGDSFLGVGLYRVDHADTTADLTGPINPLVTTGILGTTAFTGRSISKIVVHPGNADVIFVATTTGGAGPGGTALSGTVPPLALLGLYRSSNATTAAPSFEKLTITSTGSLSPDTTGNSRVMDLALDPANSNVLLATVFTSGFSEGGIYRTANALAPTPTFTRTLTLNLSGGNAIRASLAINNVAATTTVIAATGESSGVSACSSAGDLGAVRKSTDGGQTWSGKLGAGGFCGGQCFYDQPVAIDPDNANLVYLGGPGNGTCSRVYQRSVNGAASFAQSDTGLHADAHAIAVSRSTPSVLYIGNDGGIWKSTDSGATWTSLNNTGFNATQFESLALHPIDREFMIGGTQDNGTELKRANATWTRADFGDGGYALIDQSATDTDNVTMYHTYFNQFNAMGYARVTASADASEGNWDFFGCGFVAGTNGLNCTSSASTTGILFYAPMALGPGNPNTLYFASDTLFRSSDRGLTMVPVSQSPLQSIASGPVAVSAIGASPQADDVRAVGTRFGKVFATMTADSTLVDVTGPWPTSADATAQPRRFVSRVVIDPNDRNTAYVTFATYGAGAPKIWKTTDLTGMVAGFTAPATGWVPADAGIPDIPVSAFVVDPRDANNLFAGTDIGVYNSTDGGASWNPYGTGLPVVAVFDLAIHVPTGTLRAATHGRGLWEIAAGKATPTFSNLSSPLVSVAEAGAVPIGGVIKAGSLVPPGGVDITVNGVTQAAPISATDGTFSSTFDASAFGTGSFPITYAFAGDADYNPANGSGSLEIVTTLKATTTTIAAPAITYPADALVSVTVASGGGTPVGNVLLTVDGGDPLTQPLVAGVATFTIPGLGAGTHNLSATYPRQGSFPDIFETSSDADTVAVAKATPVFSQLTFPTIALGQSPSILEGVLVAGATAPSGTVTVTLDGVTSTPTVGADGSFLASFNTSALAVGPYTLTYDFAGDTNFNAASASGSLKVVPGTTATVSNLAGITINDSATATPSPSTITVAGLTGTVLKAKVTLTGLTHSFLSDTAYLLVGPGGQSSILLYHSGPQTSAIAGASNVTLTFDDSGMAFPTGTAPASGTWRPTQNDFPFVFQTGGTPGPNPPASGYGTRLFRQNGGPANGIWRLYAQDDFGGDSGSITSWALTLTTAAVPAVSVGDVSVAEGDSGSSNATFTVSLSSASAQAVTVDYTTANGTAHAGLDYTTTSGTLTFAAFETSKTVDVPVLGDVLTEGDESFTLKLSNATNATIADDTGTGTITDDDGAPVLSVDDVAQAEGDSGTTTFTFTVTLDHPSATAMTVDYATSSGTATADVDFAAASGTLYIPAFATSATFNVSVFGDVLGEPDETFTVTLTNPVGASIGDGTGVGTIQNDEAFANSVSLSDVTQAEGNSGKRNFPFVATLSAPSLDTITVRYGTIAYTAAAGRDYVAVAGTLTFAPGETRKTINVPVIGDRAEEQDEIFLVVLYEPVNTTLDKFYGVGVIVNDDGVGPVRVSIGDATVAEGDTGTTTATFTVRLSRATNSVVVVGFRTADGTATLADGDYVAATGILSFAPGATTKTISVTVNGDTNPGEANETFFVQLYGARNAVIGHGVGKGTITDVD